MNSTKQTHIASKQISWCLSMCSPALGSSSCHHAPEKEWVLGLEVNCEKNIDIYNQLPSLSKT